MIKFIKKFLYSSYIKKSIISLLSFPIIYLAAIINFIFKQRINPLSNIFGEILIIGSGPSLSRLNQDIINNHDFIIFLNSAFQTKKIFDFSKKKVFLMIWDNFRLQDSILKNEESKNLIKDMHLIINPINFYKLDVYIKAIIRFSCKKTILFPYPRFYLPWRNPSKQLLKSFITSELPKKKHLLKPHVNIFGCIFILPRTIALCAFYLVLTSRNKLNLITFVGCDFKGQEASTLIKKQFSSTSLNNVKIILWFNVLKKIANKRQIKVQRIL